MSPFHNIVWFCFLLGHYSAVTLVKDNNETQSLGFLFLDSVFLCLVAMQPSPVTDVSFHLHFSFSYIKYFLVRAVFSKP
jgi:hypothetical protein